MIRLEQLKTFVASAYLIELPRILREHRWCLLLGFLVAAAGFSKAYHDTRQGGMEPIEIAAVRWTDSLFPFTSRSLWGYGWLGFFAPNMIRVLLSVILGFLSLGIWPLRLVWVNAVFAGHLIGTVKGVAAQASGVGSLGTAIGVFMPHGLFEYSALFFAWALAFRVGLVWLVSLPGLSTFQSVKRLFRDFTLSLFAVIPLLLVAGLLESYANPPLRDRYLLGIGTYPAVTETRIGQAFAVTEVALSTSGEYLSGIGAARHRLWLKALNSKATTLLAETQLILSSPSWSPRGDRIAVIRSPFAPAGDSDLGVIDLTTRNLQTIPGGPKGCYLNAAWSPTDERIALVMLERSSEKQRSINLWLLDLRSKRWRRLTDFRHPGEIPIWTGLCWRPDGKAIAFVRNIADDADSQSRQGDSAPHGIWIVSADDGKLDQLAGGLSCRAMAWSPNGNWLAFISSLPTESSDRNLSQEIVGDLCLLDLRGNGAVRNIAKADLTGRISWSPDDKNLVYQRIGTCILGRLTILK